MKFSLLGLFTIIIIMAFGFMMVAPFVQTTNAHDNSLVCDAASSILSAYYSMVMYYCYSGEVYNPDMCNAYWAAYGAQAAHVEEVCAHDPDEEHD